MDEDFHGFFRRINWTPKVFQYLNRIQDNWSVLNHSNAQPQSSLLNHSSSKNEKCTDKITRKLNSEQIIIDYLAYLYEQMVKAEQFYIKMRNDYVDQFIKLQVQIFEKISQDLTREHGQEECNVGAENHPNQNDAAHAPQNNNGTQCGVVRRQKTMHLYE